jgi:hypothetical protein
MGTKSGFLSHELIVFQKDRHAGARFQKRFLAALESSRIERMDASVKCIIPQIFKNKHPVSALHTAPIRE